jgi:hypothetical protein
VRLVGYLKRNTQVNIVHYSRDDKSPAITLTHIGCLSELQSIDTLSRQELRAQEIRFSMVIVKRISAFHFLFHEERNKN